MRLDLERLRELQLGGLHATPGGVVLGRGRLEGRRGAARRDQEARVNPGKAAVALGALLMLAACTHGEHPPLGTVRDFRVGPYLGTWYEIAAIPAWFQRDCARDAMARYRPAAEPGQIEVVNSCRRADGTLLEAEGHARLVGPEHEGRLEVTFVRLLGYWVWPIAGAYDVVALDPGYRWSLVGHPSRDYAWILARERRLDDAVLLRLKERLAAERYDPCRLVLTASADPRRGRSLCALGTPP
jgi:apolipoprotein D and lipocalin family protein